MRVAVLVTEFPVVSELFIVRQLTGLLDRGHEVTVFGELPAVPAQHERIDAYQLLDRTVFRPAVPASLPARALGALSLLRREPPRGIASMLRTLDPRRGGKQALSLRTLYAATGWARSGLFDVVHAHFGPNGVTAVDLRAAGSFDAPVVTTFHGHDVNVLPGGPGARGYDRLFRDGERFTFNSEFLAEKAIRVLGCPASRTTVLRMGVELPDRPAGDRPDRPMQLLTVARLVPEKGVADAISAVERAVAAGADLHYRVVGGGPLEGELRRQVAAAGLDGVVTLSGAASEVEVRAAYEESDAFLLPSVRAEDGSEEAQGLVLQEAQAMCLPVISTRIGGIPEGLVADESGFLVEAGDTDAMADRLLTLSRDPALRARMGSRGRALVHERFDIERLNDQLVDVLVAACRGER
jgi:colanic acid/amylovoran biosynthesis glycosyltransferase